ncbi:unnamed protein product [Callosobruchus maculatus]|uniref:Uncharacterized protein n=1 Tax=Callosobruchus maculatus TaxID=64391 RepID=A0A653BGM6_CALMS|nr:unnamed protein product [Callosobruchus maculatus]
MVWPISCDLIPYDIFSTTFDTATELTRHGQGSTEKSHEEFSKEVVEFFEEHNEKHKL